MEEGKCAKETKKTSDEKQTFFHIQDCAFFTTKQIQNSLTLDVGCLVGSAVGKFVGLPVGSGVGGGVTTTASPQLP